MFVFTGSRNVARGGAARAAVHSVTAPSVRPSRLAMQHPLFEHSDSALAPLPTEAPVAGSAPAGPPPAPPHTLRACVLASGSRGNATFVECGDTAILIDCGISARRVIAALAALDRTLADLTAVFVTHCHGDHFGQLPSLLKRVDVPVYATRATLRRVSKKLASAARPVTPSLQPITPLRAITLGALTIMPIPTIHDAPQSVAFAVEAESRRFAVITDLGRVNPPLERLMPTLDAAVLEANHDLTLLRQGPYPAMLKRRVAGSHGHLSNVDCAALVAAHASSRLHCLWLAHLSAENNRPDVARDAVQAALDSRADLAHVALGVARQDEPGPAFWV